MKVHAIALGLIVALIGEVPSSTAQRIGHCPKPTSKKLISVKQVRGVILDKAWARVPTIEMKLQKRATHSFQDFRTTTSSSDGTFEFGVVPAGPYRLIAVGHGRYAWFCKQSLMVNVSDTGWRAFRMRVPQHASDSCPGDCDAAIDEVGE